MAAIAWVTMTKTGLVVSYVRVSGVFGDEWYVADMGFRGDRIENVLWRVIEGELLGVRTLLG